LEPIEVFYPESDGKPMAETDLHRMLLLDLVEAADRRFEDDPDIYVSGNLLIYFVEGHPEKCVAPDVFVVRGVAKRLRPIYKVWEEGKGPDVVVELTSPSTHREDLEEKRTIYERLGVREYFIFDPEGRRFKPPFRGFRLEEGVLRPMPPARLEGGKVVFRSEVLDLELHGGGPSLRWVDPATGEPLPIPRELFRLAMNAKDRADRERARAEIEQARAEQEQARAEREQARAEQEQARAEREQARAEQEQARAEREQARAEQEQARAEREQAHAEQEQARADRAEAELARLREEISRRRER
jgi:Uma2 family endonuclease